MRQAAAEFAQTNKVGGSNVAPHAVCLHPCILEQVEGTSARGTVKNTQEAVTALLEACTPIVEPG